MGVFYFHQPFNMSNVKTPESLSCFGELCFNRKAMKEYLDEQTFNAMIKVLDEKEQPSSEVIDSFAQGVLRWAAERGCTHITHVFQPLSGIFGEKHDIMFKISADGDAAPHLKGSTLMSGEPDGSSFPNGGVRPTHAARGNTLWDPRSLLTIGNLGKASTLRVPSIFVAWTGVSLDFKTPLLRSENALAKATLNALKASGDNTHTRVESHCGLEQEFFLIDEPLFRERPDLVQTGRTLIGLEPPRGQDHSDRYFGFQATRVQDCLFDIEQELWRLGIPNSTRHREVAPGQYEMAPLFQNANQANDNNLLMMEIMKEIAKKHGLVALFHEKPFARLNGSGKHNNWSFGTDKDRTFFSPKSPNFLLAVAAFVRGVHLHGDILRSAVATSGNDHRLGGHEAPPGIMSMYVGDDIEDMIQRAINGEEVTYEDGSQLQEFGIGYLPSFKRQACDRNRTSPIAFCGNRFEFRAVGSSVNTAWSTTVLNAITAESMQYLADEIEKAVAAGEKPFSVISKTLREHQCVIFNGDGYSAEWPVEAERRGLLNIPNTASALPALSTERAQNLFQSQNILTNEELEVRRNVFYDNFNLDLQVELRCMIQLCKGNVLPAVYRHQSKMGEYASEASMKKLTALSHKLREQVTTLSDLETQAEGIQDNVALAEFMQNSVRPELEAVRTTCDDLESLVDASCWQLPTYHQMLNSLF